MRVEQRSALRDALILVIREVFDGPEKRYELIRVVQSYFDLIDRGYRTAKAILALFRGFLEAHDKSLSQLARDDFMAKSQCKADELRKHIENVDSVRSNLTAIIASLPEDAVLRAAVNFNNHNIQQLVLELSRQEIARESRVLQLMVDVQKALTLWL